MIFKLLKKLFKKPSKDEETTALHDITAISEKDWDIIGAYGEVLEKRGEEYPNRLLFPLSALPHPKAEIESALNRALEVAKDENITTHLETALVSLGDFLPNNEIPDDPDEDFELWLSRKDWKDPKTIKHFASVLSRVFIEKYGDDAEQKIDKFFEDLKNR
jgi:hypothetical protein